MEVVGRISDAGIFWARVLPDTAGLQVVQLRQKYIEHFIWLYFWCVFLNFNLDNKKRKRLDRNFFA